MLTCIVLVSGLDQLHFPAENGDTCTTHIHSWQFSDTFAKWELHMKDCEGTPSKFQPRLSLIQWNCKGIHKYIYIIMSFRKARATNDLDLYCVGTLANEQHIGPPSNLYILYNL